MCASGLPPERPVVFDTVVANYFLAVGAFELLASLVGEVHVPRAVFDPDEDEGLVEEALSELRRGLHLHRRRAQDPGLPRVARQRSASALPHFETLPRLAAERRIVVVDLTAQELDLFATFRDGEEMRAYSLLAALGRGEAAALAVAEARGWLLATDDTDAIKVAQVRIEDFAPLRIRSLLERAVELTVCTLAEARALHEAMKRMGFWDRWDLS